jgi:hypothetical protein
VQLVAEMENHNVMDEQSKFPHKETRDSTRHDEEVGIPPKFIFEIITCIALLN